MLCTRFIGRGSKKSNINLKGHNDGIWFVKNVLTYTPIIIVTMYIRLPKGKTTPSLSPYNPITQVN